MRVVCDIPQSLQAECPAQEIRIRSRLCPDYIEGVNVYTQKEKVGNRFAGRSEDKSRQARQFTVLVAVNGRKPVLPISTKH